MFGLNFAVRATQLSFKLTPSSFLTSARFYSTRGPSSSLLAPTRYAVVGPAHQPLRLWQWERRKSSKAKRAAAAVSRAPRVRRLASSKPVQASPAVAALAGPAKPSASPIESTSAIKSLADLKYQRAKVLLERIVRGQQEANAAKSSTTPSTPFAKRIAELEGKSAKLKAASAAKPASKPAAKAAAKAPKQSRRRKRTVAQRIEVRL